jgi:hypothetical protein
MEWSEIYFSARMGNSWMWSVHQSEEESDRVKSNFLVSQSEGNKGELEQNFHVLINLKDLCCTVCEAKERAREQGVNPCLVLVLWDPVNPIGSWGIDGRTMISLVLLWRCGWSLIIHGPAPGLRHPHSLWGAAVCPSTCDPCWVSSGTRWKPIVWTFHG